MALATDARHEFDRDAFERWMEDISRFVDDDADVKHFISYESCLWAANDLDYGQLHVQLTNWSPGDSDPVWKMRKAALLFEAGLQEGSGQITGVWFNQPYLGNTLAGRPNVALAGRVDYGRSGLQLTSPEYELDAAERLHAGRLVPVYPLTAGVTQRQLRRWVSAAVDSHAHLVEDPLPDALRQRRELPGLAEAVAMMHRPDSAANADAAMARLAFDELLVYQLAILTHRGRWRGSQPGRPIAFDRDAMAALKSAEFARLVVPNRGLWICH